MPSLLILLLAGAGIWAGYALYRKEQARVQASLREAEELLRQRDEESIPTLKRDPESGVYKPADR